MENGDACLSMEEGGTELGTMIESYKDEEKQFTALEVASVTMGIARALSYLHNDQKILHGDIKSGNILVSGKNQSFLLGLSMSSFIVTRVYLRPIGLVTTS